MELAQPFVRLPFQFDVEQLRRELESVGNDHWMAHPSKLAGNRAIPLISVNGTDNNDFTGRMQPTPHLEQCRYMQQVMANFDEVLARSRLMGLDAGAEVSPHVDFNYHWYSRVRIHIPIVTNPNVIFYCGDQNVHMQSGECWIFDSWRRHNVVNDGDQFRVHLVVDIAGSSRFWNMVDEMQQIDSNIKPDAFLSRLTELPFDERKEVSLRTERYNVSPVMSPGELHAIARELIEDFSANAENDAGLVSKYTKILMDLSHDWREAWHTFGYEQQAWDRYRQLLQLAFSQLGENPRELVTASNSVGVKPIIVQRILRAAVNQEQLDFLLP